MPIHNFQFNKNESHNLAMPKRTQLPQKAVLEPKTPTPPVSKPPEPAPKLASKPEPKQVMQKPITPKIKGVSLSITEVEID